MNKQEFIQQVAEWARIPGYTDIKANAEGFTKPGGYGRQQDGESFVPDVTGIQSGARTYFEVMLKTSDKDYLTAKLKLLHQLTIINGGKLFLMAPKGHSIFAKNILEGSRINAEIVPLPERRK